jgi:hypothetical protein
MATIPPSIVDFIVRVQQHVRATDSLLAPLRPDVPAWHPIPFFGRVEQAAALTVAMNPSAGEFRNRGWPAVLSSEDLAHRLLTYFTNPRTPPHPWFDDSERPLRAIGLRYASNLAHLDLVPRGTRTVAAADGDDFLQLGEADAWCFFEALDLAAAARLVILTGSFTKRFYAHEWVARRAPSFGWMLVDKPRRIPGGAFATFHTLRRRGRWLPVFFTSASVNSRKGVLDYERLVQANRSDLAEILARSPES